MLKKKTMKTKKKAEEFFSRYKTFFFLICVCLMLLFLVTHNTEIADAAAPWTNIEVCVQPPDPILTDPESPVLRYLTRYHPFYYYQIQISKSATFSSILHDAGVKAYQSTFSYSRSGSTSCQWQFGRGTVCTFTPTVANGHPDPRCSCDTDTNSLNCGSSFSASADDPAVCYDWSFDPVQTTCQECSVDDGAGSSWSVPCNCVTTPAHDYSYVYNKTESATAMPVGTYSYTVPAGTLPIDGSTYYYRVRVKDAYDWSPYASGNFFLGAADGVCGTPSFCEDKIIDPISDRGDLCVPGLPSITKNNYNWSWTCLGLYGGADSPACSASVTPVPGCGTRTVCSGDAVSCQSGMCTNGGACAMTGDTTWSCTNSCGTANCNATVLTPEIGQCGSLDGSNYCQSGAPSSDLCSPASSYNNDLTNHYTEWTWTCGSTACGGSVESCSAGNLRTCGWIETNP